MSKVQYPTEVVGLGYVKEANGKSVAIYPALKNRARPAGDGHPEEAVRMQAYNELITKYSYPPELIDIEFPVVIREDENPRFADIVVFSDKEHKRPFIVVETKQPKKSEGEKQGQRYATILRAVYVLWTNGSQRSTSVIVNRYPEEAVPTNDIPPFGGKPKFAITKLEAFKDDKQVADAVRKCHNLVRNLNNLKPDDAFNEFLKILLVKFEDESKETDFDFQVLLKGDPPQPEPTNETAQRIRLLFKFAVEHEAEISSVFDKDEDIALTNDCIAQIVKVLQPFSFSTTSVDQKGRAFETFITGDMRQEFKEFMTPRPVIEAIVQMADPLATHSILDPTCGSGAFLTFSLEHVRKQIERKDIQAHQKIKAVFDFAHDRLWGLDASPQMSAVARINMLVNEDGRAHIFTHDSLLPKSKAPYPIRSKVFDFILTNPPFGKKITQPSSLLESFEITKDHRGKLKKGGYLTEVLFLERNLQWLRPGGLMFIVLPDSVLGNSTLRDQRAYIERLARIVAIFSLSPDTFGPSGAKSKTSVAVLEKRSEESNSAESDEDYPIFLSHVAHVGYDFTGRATSLNSLPDLVADYLRFKSGQSNNFKISAVVTRKQLGQYWLAQPHVRPQNGKSKLDEWSLGDVCQTITNGKTAPRNLYKSSGLHLIKVGNLTGRGIEWDAVERQYVDKEFAERHPTAVLKKGDILFTAAAHGPKWIGLKVDIYEGAPKHISKPVLACGEIMICRLNRKLKIDPYFVLLYLRSGAGYQAIQHCIRGQSGHVYPIDVAKIRIPKPSQFNSTELKKALSTLKKSLRARRSSADADSDSKRVAENLFPSELKKPIIAT